MLFCQLLVGQNLPKPLILLVDDLSPYNLVHQVRHVHLLLRGVVVVHHAVETGLQVLASGVDLGPLPVGLIPHPIHVSEVETHESLQLVHLREPLESRKSQGVKRHGAHQVVEDSLRGTGLLSVVGRDR